LITPIANTKRIFLTGASGKIGIKILKIFLELGFSVVAHCSKNEAIIADFLKKNPQYKNSVEILKVNFEIDVPEIPEDISCLVNCASIFEKGNLENNNHLLKTTMMNAFFPAELTAQFAKIAQNERELFPNVINILDGNVYRFNKNYQNYRISKLLLEELTKQSAILFAPKIRVNAIALGMLEEDENPSNIQAKQKEILTDEISDEKITQVIEFLITCENLTGQIIYLDNGAHLL
jgi:NAD(P)-dependent dehydrogenase (short-subunit alcohol dehydrogenase family)